MNLIAYPTEEKIKKENALKQSMDSLTETMGELFLVEKMTGRKGLPERVYLAFSEALQCAMKLAKAEVRK